MKFWKFCAQHATFACQQWKRHAICLIGTNTYNLLMYLIKTFFLLLSDIFKLCIAESNVYQSRKKKIKLVCHSILVKKINKVTNFPIKYDLFNCLYLTLCTISNICKTLLKHFKQILIKPK